MFERQNSKKTPRWVWEEGVDKLLASGDISAAKRLLDRVPSDKDPTVFSHTDFKAAALPLYDLAYHPPTDERIRAANDTYGLIARLMHRELNAYNNFSASKNEKNSHIGRLSEFVIFNLPLREKIEEGSIVLPLPASRRNDKDGNIDFFLSPIGTGQIDDGWPYQVKAFLQTDRPDESPPLDIIPVISLEELDPYARTPNNHASLVQRILRELAGTSTDEDHATLTAATSKFYEKVIPNKNMGRQAGRQWRIAKLARNLHRSAVMHEAAEVG